MSDLLPPNATALERNLATTNAAISDIDVPLRTLMNPDTIRADLLPWLAWHLGVDTWKDYWPESVKRARVKQAIPIARKKGTAAAVREVVATFGANLVLREWFEKTPRGTPGTFDIVMTVSGRDGEPATAEYVADIIAEIERTKPVRAHYTFTQGYAMQARVGVACAAQPAIYRRLTLSDI
ncbi:phage tail P2-like protein [Paraburkholderia eburnea]|uniref:Phage tail P2-like protein n=1 Tax=Paraburkholderia eburnea TaxID=1189126 RepID=A0A2S4LWM9_9BURK|nr:phage tail protein I [Paraburkholderia eburnea]POR46749.1 phage tail P2-like protein [Paraburkholderia eburnea]PRZ17938.1 phage tail P2-like protein [Paraburkholderia eburnea]